MFNTNETLGSSNVRFDRRTAGQHTNASADDAIPIRRATPGRLADLVHHLGGVPLRDARRAVDHTETTCTDHDPLSIVAAALIELRRGTDQNRYIGV